jgi:hypothetical protein
LRPTFTAQKYVLKLNISNPSFEDDVHLNNIPSGIIYSVPCLPGNKVINEETGYSVSFDEYHVILLV